MLHVGIGLEEVVRFNAERGLYGPGTADDFIAARLETPRQRKCAVRLKLQPGGVIEVRSARMPDGGIVTTYTDVTRTVAAEEALEATNETLEQRVRERTEELVEPQCRTRPRQGAGRRGQSFEDALSRRREP